MKPLAEIPSDPKPEPQVAASPRVNKPSDAVSAYQTLFNDDFQASRDRATVQSMVDGNSPYDPARLRLLGIEGITNVNWGLLTEAQSEAEAPYNDVLESMSSFGDVPVKDGILSDTEATIQEPIIAEELYSMITGWEDFYFNWWMLAHYFTMFGVGFTYREGHLDWRWKSASLQQVKIPRGVKANINLVDRICMKDSMSPSELYGKIGDERLATASGWNPNAVRHACAKAAPAPLNTSSPEELQAMWKDNAVFSGNTAVVVEVVYMWVRELDGTVSQYIAAYTGEDAHGFLYQKRSVYGCMSEFINGYLLCVGTNGDMHSIRGNASALFPSASALNRLMCKFIDKATDEANTFISAESEDTAIDNMLTPRGPYFQLSTGVSFVERQTPPVAGNLVPAIGAMREIFAARSGGMAPRVSSTAEQGQKTKYELVRKDQMDAGMTTASMNLFFVAWLRDYREIVKRVSNPDLQESHPGGKEVFEFRRRCVARGVNPKALTNLDHKQASVNRGIGNGSSAERRSTLDMFMERLASRLDPEGQRILTRDFAAAYTNARYALTLVPREEGQRPPIDKQIANLENQMLQLSVMPVLEPNQDHVVHVGTHVELLQSINDALAQVEMELEDAIPQMQQASQHAGEHMQYIDQNSQDFRTYREALQQLNEVITNGAKHLEAQQRKARKAQEEGKAAPESETPSGVHGQAVDARARLESLVGLSQAKIELMRKEAAQKAEIRRVEAVQQLAIIDAKEAQKMKHLAMQQSRSAKTPVKK